MEIRALREADERSQFRSGDPDLDRFIHRFAAQNQFRHYVGVTYVSVEEGHILGFAFNRETAATPPSPLMPKAAASR